MKTRSLGIAFAALLAFAPVRGSAEGMANSAAPADAATPAEGSSDRPVSVSRRYAKKQLRHYAYWEPFPIYWPNYYRHRLTWRRVAWFIWF